MKQTVISRFVAYITQNRGLSARTGTEYEKDLRIMQAWLMNTAKVERWSEVTKEDIDNMVATWTQDRIMPATIHRRVSCLRTFYQWAWIQGLQTENPAKFVSTPKLGVRTPKTLETAEIAATIEDTTIDATTRVMITVMAETGIRIAELLSLRQSDVDKETQQLTVRGKGNKERRVYYGKGTAEFLQYVDTTRGDRLFRLEDREARERIYRALRKHTKREKCSSHCLRHTWATSMLNAGADLETISKLMGHATVKTTERYAQVAGARTAAQYNKYHTDYGRKEA